MTKHYGIELLRNVLNSQEKQKNTHTFKKKMVLLCNSKLDYSDNFPHRKVEI